MNGDPQRGPRGWPPLAPAWTGVELRRGGAGAARVSGGGSGAGAGFPSPAPAAPGQLMQFPPDYFPAEGATDFELQGDAAGLTVAMGPVTLATFTVPSADRAVIRSVVLGVNDYTAVGLIRFRVLINGNAPPCWGNLRIPPQAAAFASFSYGPDETRILVNPGSQIALVVQVVAGGPFGASATAHGWHWSGS